MPNMLMTLGAQRLSTSEPLANYKIEVWNQEDPQNRFMGSDNTDASGEAKVYISAQDFEDVYVNGAPQTYFMMYSNAGALVLDTRVGGDQNEETDVKITLISFAEAPVDPGIPLSVSGTIQKNDGGVPIPAVNVVAYDKDVVGEKELGSIITNPDGTYRIDFNSNDLTGVGRTQADLRVRVFDQTDTNFENPLAISPLLVDALEDEIVNLVIGSEVFVGLSEYKQVNNVLAPAISNNDPAAFNDEDTLVLAGKFNVDADWSNYYVKARAFANETGVEAEVFYGLMRRELPDELSDLLSEERSILQQELEAAAFDNVIATDLVSDIDALLNQLEAARETVALNESNDPENEGSVGRILQIVGFNETQKQIVVQKLLSADPSNELAVWDELDADPNFTQAELDKLELALRAAAVTQNNFSMVQAIIDNPAISTFKDLTALTEADWDALITTHVSGIPETIDGETEEERKANYKSIIFKLLEDTFPTTLVSKELSAAPDFDTTDFDTFFGNNPDFDFKEDNVNQYIQDNPEALQGIADTEGFTKNLEAMRRVFFLTPETTKSETIKTLLNNGLDSAYKIRKYGKKAFLNKFADLFGGEEAAERIYRRASNISSQALTVIARYSNTFNSINTSVFSGGVDGTPNQGFTIVGAAAAAPQNIPNLESLFKTADFCSCLHCRSVLSPAAFLVDLLEFIELGDNLNNASSNARLVLNERRPDIQSIKLNCDNTNTVLPYIDLVNELLENQVSPATSDYTGQTTGDTASLMAMPAYINKDAYDKLALEAFPIQLPFNLWTEETRSYLAHLAIRHSDVIRHFSPVDDPDKVRNRSLAIINYTQKDFDIFESPVADAGQFYGLTSLVNLMPDGNDIASNLGIVSDVLVALGINFDELKQYLECDAINPTRKQVEFDAPDSCDLTNASLDLNNQEFHDLNRFRRLQLKSGWLIFDLDRVFRAFNTATNEEYLIQLGYINELSDLFKLSIKRLMGWFSFIDTRSYGEEISFYDELFLNPAITTSFDNAASLFALNPDRTELLDTTPVLTEETVNMVVRAAINVSEDDYIAIVNSLGSQNLTLANLSEVYRLATFSKAMKLSVKDVFDVKSMTGLDFNSPETMETFTETVASLKSLRVSIAELTYLVRNQKDENTGVSEDTITVILTQLRGELQKLLATEEQEVRKAEQLDNNLLSVLDEEDIATVHAIIYNSPELTDQEKTDFINAKLSVFLDPADATAKLVTGPGLISDTSERIDYVLIALLQYLAKDYVVQRMTAELDLEAFVVEAMLNVYVKSPLDGSKVAMDVFLDPTFVNSIEDINSASNLESMQTLERLLKVGFFADVLRISSEDIAFILSDGPSINWYNIAEFPVTFVDSLGAAEAASWLQLLNTKYLDRTYFNGNLSSYQFLKQTLDTANSDAQILDLLSGATGWLLEDIQYLTSPQGYNFGRADFSSEGWIQQMSSAFELLERSEARASQIWSLNSLDSTAEQGGLARTVANASYSAEEWLKVAPEIRDSLREKQRDALQTYVVNDQGFASPDDLYSYYLVDTQMSACTPTSRIKLAISSVQLWVQRILLGLEAELEFDAELTKQWVWRKNYRVWEANRKIFLYPENWIEPELRDDKTPFFLDLENELLQDELTSETVESAYLNYLRKLDEVSRLEIVGVFDDREKEEDLDDEEKGIYYVIGRTANKPNTYYLRKFVDRSYWTPWEKIDLEIESNHFLPIIYNRRLYLFWAVFNQKSEEPTDAELEVTADKDQQASRNPKLGHEIKLGWTSYYQGRWTDPKLTEEVVQSEYNEPSRHFLVSSIKDDELYIDIVYPGVELSPIFSRYRKTTGIAGISSSPLSRKKYARIQNRKRFFVLDGFKFNDYANRLILNETAQASEEGLAFPKPVGSDFDNMKFKEGIDRDALVFDTPSRSSALDKNNSTVLKNTPGDFKITLLHQYWDQDELESPTFYEDDFRSYFVIPKKEKYSFTERYPIKFSTTPLRPASRPRPKVLPFYKPTIATRPTVVTPTFSSAPLINPTTVNGFYVGDNSFAVVKTNELLQLNLSSAQLVRTNSSDFIRDVRAFEERVPEVGNITVQQTKLRLLPTVQPILPTTTIRPFFKVKRIVSTRTNYEFYNFYHPFTRLFIKQINKFGIDGLLNPLANVKGTPAQQSEILQLDRQQIVNDNFVSIYQPTSAVLKAPLDFDFTLKEYPKEEIDFSYDGAYSQYNWELFFHAPLSIATQLSANQRFEEAQKWFHYIFDPTETNGDAPARFWKTNPFHFYQGVNQTSEVLDLINQGNKAFRKQVVDWQKNPFQPHVVARMRIVAYMKTVVMKYLDNLIAWGDNLFRRDTIESINEATQLYVLAAQILGRKPEIINRSETETGSYNDIKPDIDSFSNALVEIETEVQLDMEEAQNTDVEEDGQINILNTILYFCLPPNDKLLGYWDTVADRLFKIRNCQNIEGVARQLALFEPPIDPGLLVRAAAAGIDLSSAITDLNAPIPNYRFEYMLQRAYDFSNEVRNLGSAMLSALEKKDGEDLALLRAGHEVDLLKQVRRVREEAIREARENLDSLEEAKELARIRERYYGSRENISTKEAVQIGLITAATVSQGVSAGLRIFGSAASFTPQFQLGVAGAFGSPFATSEFGGKQISEGATKAADALFALGNILNLSGNITGLLAGYERRQDDWDFQLELAEKEIEQIDKQILAARARLSMMERELENHDLQTEQSQEVNAFLQDKYTNRELYQWMTSQLAGIYFQTFQMAYDVAKRVERNMQFELALENTNYIKFGYWDSLKKGLLAGEQLQKDLRRLEMAYIEQNKREYEITRHISIATFNPQALLQLRENGACEVHLSEALFDMDYPGQYLRRIKSVSVTIPCVTGPYTNVNCKLTLLNSRVRKSTETGSNPSDYTYQGVEDPRFNHYFTGTEAIATSSAQRDSGLFEFNFRDERYLPFERLGAISTWRLELPQEFRQFDYDTISDAIVHINYTARDGGVALRQQVEQNLKDELNKVLDELAATETGLSRMLSLEREFSTEMTALLYPASDTEDYKVTIDLKDKNFAYFLKGRDLDMDNAYVIVRLKEEYQTSSLDGLMLKWVREGETANFKSVKPAGNSEFGGLQYSDFLGITGEAKGKWELMIKRDSIASLSDALKLKDDTGAPISNSLDPKVIDDIYVLLNFKLA